MRKIVLLLFLFTGIVANSQKSLEIYNYSSKTITISIIVTKPPTGIYPWYGSVTPSQITIAAGSQYILQNSSDLYRFPFDSPSSSPYITNWRYSVQSTGGNGSFSNVTSNVAWANGANQNFNYISYTVNNLTAGWGTSGVNNPVVQDFTNHWEADYDLFVSGNTIINTIVFFDI